MTKLTHYVPGVTLGVAIAVVALYLGKITTVFNDIIIAIVIGALIRNLFNVPANFKQGLTFCLKKVLRFAIILLGVQLSFQQIVKTGGQSLLLILAVVIIAIPLTYQIGKRLGLNSHMCVLLGVGSSICGASAILATGPAIKAKEGDIGLAVATVFIFNTLALLLYPIVGGVLHLSNLTYGTWIGVAVQDVSSVVATGFAFSQEAGEIATIVKLTRTVLIVPVVFFVSLFFAWKNRNEGGSQAEAKVSYRGGFPLVCAWFLAYGNSQFLRLVSENSGDNDQSNHPFLDSNGHGFGGHGY